MPRLDNLTYRTAQTEPGEPLILPGSPVDRLLRSQQWITALGLDLSQVVDSALVALPIPKYEAPVDDEMPQWSDAEPSMLWHPFFWLPPRLTERLIDADADTGVQTLESDDQWALRVMWEMAAQGLYDVETGEWADILAWKGLDVDDREDLMRISEWQLGVADEVLDHIDLEPLLLVEEDPYWAVEAAGRLEDTVRRTVWARTANHLMSWAFQTEELFNQNGDADDLRGRILSILRCASMLLTSVNSDGLGAHAQPGPDKFWAQTMGEIHETSADALLDVLNARVALHLQNVRDAHWEETVEFWAEYENAAVAPGA